MNIAAHQNLMLLTWLWDSTVQNEVHTPAYKFVQTLEKLVGGLRYSKDHFYGLQ